MAVLEGLVIPDSYTIGWIAPLPIERAAAISMLDERHEESHDFTQHPSDENPYTWAITTSGLLSSPSQIKISLLVALSGGIARPEQGRDIRLGNVVVSEPQATSGGVIQYELGKARAGSNFVEKTIFNRASTGLSF
ncbi:uncharacterized protein N7443_005904 [Penicillium atrosanguineum]|uniref:Uncharacterized protein n=1 Tax=Penicillium atrosanguineum TaxID=1132637 RepID=A0A9W9PX85_9EURO|nr:uncharacterized protein N7443_005904 [Penicillium atrosanguineum]KAJ5128790.1 hypothetical protein N7526_006956 [Penicillium atrosanguineum]KAJ5300902.1 hypothetical protein N7443_005904 [Penicillium atrosanguineum]KAJ5311547.1 hypothetical protein N7476_007407 [Penicillium atrosanguineum]